jgi:hypothetical protein
LVFGWANEVEWKAIDFSQHWISLDGTECFGLKRLEMLVGLLRAGAMIPLGMPFGGIRGHANSHGKSCRLDEDRFRLTGHPSERSLFR